jgi:hypothetical protein
MWDFLLLGFAGYQEVRQLHYLPSLIDWPAAGSVDTRLS